MRGAARLRESQPDAGVQVGRCSLSRRRAGALPRCLAPAAPQGPACSAVSVAAPVFFFFFFWGGFFFSSAYCWAGVYSLQMLFMNRVLKEYIYMFCWRLLNFSINSALYLRANLPFWKKPERN